MANMVWTIWNKGKLNSEKMKNTETNCEMILKILQKGKSKSDKIWTIWMKDKLNSEKI
jgi:hypothetical protein